MGRSVEKQPETGRRQFILSLGVALGSGSAVLAQPVSNRRKTDHMTVQDVINTIVREIPGERLAETVDTLKVGNPNQPVTGITTTFMATCNVIRKSLEVNSNLIITHEPTFYNHLDEVDWLTGDAVYRHKLDLLEQSKMAVWRFHDYWHRWRPDPMDTALIEDLGWISFREQKAGNTCVIEPILLRDLCRKIKERLQIKEIRVVGHPDMVCRRVGLMPGSAGGRSQISFLGTAGVDVLVCGEVDEWETSEYVRDSQGTDEPKGLIILGHVNSEEAGMRLLVDWLKSRLPEIPITHIPAKDPFTYM